MLTLGLQFSLLLSTLFHVYGEIVEECCINKNVTLSCNASSTPRTVSWRFKEDIVCSYENGKWHDECDKRMSFGNKENFFMTIQYVTDHDAGKYECEIEYKNKPEWRLSYRLDVKGHSRRRRSVDEEPPACEPDQNQDLPSNSSPTRVHSPVLVVGVTGVMVAFVLMAVIFIRRHRIEQYNTKEQCHLYTT